MILEVLARHVATRGTHPFLRHENRDRPDVLAEISLAPSLSPGDKS